MAPHLSVEETEIACKIDHHEGFFGGMHMVEKKPTFAVIMSTFNGERYLKEQIESIFSQEGVDVHLYIRDDGSSDGTIALLDRLAEIHRGRLTLNQARAGENLGVYKSWEELLSTLPRDYDFYSISDQDDIWLPDKLYSAAVMINQAQKTAESSAIPVVYTSNTTAVDENLTHLRDYDFSDRPKTLEAVFIRFSYPAHVMVFNQSLFRELDGYRDDLPDEFTTEVRLICTPLVCGGLWCHDSKSHILWRRTATSFTSSGRGIAARIKSEIRLFCARGNRHIWAKALLERYGELMRIDDSVFLLHVLRLDEGFSHKRSLIFSSRFTTGNRLLDFRARLRLLFPEW